MVARIAVDFHAQVMEREELIHLLGIGVSLANEQFHAHTARDCARQMLDNKRWMLSHSNDAIRGQQQFFLGSVDDFADGRQQRGRFWAVSPNESTIGVIALIRLNRSARGFTLRHRVH